MEELLSILKETKFPKNRSRKNVLYDSPKEYCRYENKKKIWIDNSRWCYSLSFGKYKPMFKRGNGVYKNNSKFPKLYEELIKIINNFDSEFKPTQITVNKNLVCRKHKDKNKSDSYILFLGDYKGGDLFIGDRIISETNKFHKFNGKEEHYNNEITEGTKYSIIWFQ